MYFLFLFFFELAYDFWSFSLSACARAILIVLSMRTQLFLHNKSWYIFAPPFPEVPTPEQFWAPRTKGAFYEVLGFEHNIGHFSHRFR